MATLGLKVINGGHLTATRKRNVLAVLNHPEFGPQLVAGIPIRANRFVYQFDSDPTAGPATLTVVSTEPGFSGPVTRKDRYRVTAA
jgi:hypothetical protein